MFENAILIGRLLSGVLTILIIFLTYIFTQDLSDKKTAIFASIISMGSVAYLQYSHFSTFEIWITFLSLLMVYFLYKYLKSDKLYFFILSSAILGLLCGLKLSSIVLVLIPIYIILIGLFDKKITFKKILSVLKLTFLLFYLLALFYFISSPFNFLDSHGFISSMEYEGGVATGTLPVFYTGSFFNQIPIIFQFLKELPFLINPLMTLITIPAVLYIIFISIKRKNVYLGLVIISFLTIFISQSFLFAKWTRYLIPSLPFLYIMLAIFIFGIKKHLNSNIFKFLLITIVIVNYLFYISFIKTIALSSDTRLEALYFAQKNIPNDSRILSEVYDLGITPFNSSYHNINLFNFYDLDNAQDLDYQLLQELKNSDYIILPSQRIYKSRTINPDKFPNGNKFYSALFAGKLPFEMIYQTPCDYFCKITYLGNPVFNVEDTVNVFDRPSVFIFKKVK